jgi:hypothetical protein
MVPLSYMRSVDDRNVVMRRTPVLSQHSPPQIDNVKHTPYKRGKDYGVKPRSYSMSATGISFLIRLILGLFSGTVELEVKRRRMVYCEREEKGEGTAVVVCYNVL